jgi:gliding motility-associated-like protein
MRVLSMCCFLLLPACLFCQKQAENWYFGFHAGLNFSAGNPVVLTDGQTETYEGVATISDANGGLLFYTDGVTVYNKLHQVMQNGTDLYGHSSSTQSAIIVPQPSNDSIYYIFTVDYVANPLGLNYSVVNSKAANGLGAVTIKNVQLLTPTCEKVTAIMHCNNKDIWVVTHQYASDKYYAWLVTSTGIATTPVISSTGNTIGVPGGGPLHGAEAIGYLKASPDGKKIAAAYFGGEKYTELSQFDNTAGLVFNTLKIDARPPFVSTVPGNIMPYGLEFSPNSKQLYVSTAVENVFPQSISTIVQYDVSVHDSAQIAQSYYFVDSSLITHYGMQLAINKKIYIADFNKDEVSAINNPDVHGAGCGFQQSVVTFPVGITVQAGLPDFVQSYFNPDFGGYNFSVTGNCSSLNAQFQLNNIASGADSVKWNFGDAASGINNNSISYNPLHVFTASGYYSVKLIVYKNTNCIPSDTINKSIWVGPSSVNLGNDTTVCVGDTVTLRVNIPGSVKLWSNGTTDSILKVIQPGTYWVRVTLQNCIVTDTIKIFNRSLPQFTLGADTIICSNTNVTLAPIPALPGAYTWSNNAATPTITVSNAGNYWLQITDNIGCKWRDTIGVSFKTLPNFSLGNDTAICQKDTVLLNATVSGATSYTWNTGATTPQIKTYQTGIYWCDVNKQGCIYRDSIVLTVKPLPIVNLGNDTTLCENTTLLLDAQNPGSSWLWNTGSIAQTYLVSQSGLYKLTVTKNNCSNKDSINIAYELKPRFTLGADRLICPGQIITLQPALDPLWQLLWQDGSGSKTYSVAQPGLYYLDATTRCGTVREDIIFTRGLCKVNIPNAFTPNGDGRNDVLKALGTEIVTNFNLKIFNRYGQLVFETKDKAKGWDGRFNGQRANNDAYTYICTYRELNGTKDAMLKGVVLVMR